MVVVVGCEWEMRDAVVDLIGASFPEKVKSYGRFLRDGITFVC